MLICCLPANILLRRPTTHIAHQLTRLCTVLVQKVYRYFDGDNLDEQKLNTTTPVRRLFCEPASWPV